MNKKNFTLMFFLTLLIIWLIFAFLPEVLGLDLLPTGGWDWLGFVGTILGIIIALKGVVMTIENENKKNELSREADNAEMRKQNQLSVIPCLDIPLNASIEDIVEKSCIFRTFKNKEEKLINKGYEISRNPPNYFTACIVLNIRNIGLSTAFSIDMFIYKLDEVEGLESLDDIKNRAIDNFYEKIKTSNYLYLENEKDINEEWQIYTSFNLSNDDRSEVSFIFDTSSIKIDFHSIIEFRYQDIYENEYHQLLYLSFKEGSTSMLPISKIYKGKSHKVI